MQIIHEGGYGDEYRNDIKPIIYKQVIKNMKVLIRESAKPEYTPVQTFDSERSGRINQVEERILDPVEFEEQFTPQIWDDLKVLWADKSIQETHRFNYKYTLDDSTKYFLDRLDVLKEKNYLPHDQDILRCRVKTAAIVEKNFVSGDQNFRILDVGGQRNERRKWIHCFNDINALVYVVAISEYDQNLREDNVTKRLDESLKVFEDVVNNKYFKDKALILCLNKRDIFEEKFTQRHFNLYYPDFKGNTPEEAIAFISKKFFALDKGTSGRSSQVTIATDTDLIKVVFKAIVDNVLHESLRNAGFIKANKLPPN